MRKTMRCGMNSKLLTPYVHFSPCFVGETNFSEENVTYLLPSLIREMDESLKRTERLSPSSSPCLKLHTWGDRTLPRALQRED
jgi:hypothetical protein